MQSMQDAIVSGMDRWRVGIESDVELGLTGGPRPTAPLRAVTRRVFQTMGLAGYVNYYSSLYDLLLLPLLEVTFGTVLGSGFFSLVFQDLSTACLPHNGRNFKFKSRKRRRHDSFFLLQTCCGQLQQLIMGSHLA